MRSDFPTRAPVFVGGFRSGSTLLINLLGLHPELAPIFETRSICEALRWLSVLGDPRKEASEAILLRMIFREGFDGFSAECVAARMIQLIQLTEDRIHNRIPHGKASHESYPLGMDYILYDFVDAKQAVHDWLETVQDASCVSHVAEATGLFINRLGSMQAEKLTKPVWVNKTPELPRFGHELRLSLGPCKIIHLIRDGRQVVRSAAQLGWGSIADMSRLWRALIEESRVAAKEAEGDYLEIRYEHLIQDPALVLDRIFSFLDVEVTGPEVVTAYYQHSGKEIQPVCYGTEYCLQGQNMRIFERIAGSLQAELGYSLR